MERGARAQAIPPARARQRSSNACERLPGALEPGAASSVSLPTARPPHAARCQLPAAHCPIRPVQTQLDERLPIPTRKSEASSPLDLQPLPPHGPELTLTAVAYLSIAHQSPCPGDTILEYVAAAFAPRPPSELWRERAAAAAARKSSGRGDQADHTCRQPSSRPTAACTRSSMR